MIFKQKEIFFFYTPTRCGTGTRFMQIFRSCLIHFSSDVRRYIAILPIMLFIINRDVILGHGGCGAVKFAVCQSKAG